MNMRFGAYILAVTGLSLFSSAAAAQIDDGPSNYIKCDGHPNNMGAGEGLARFVGAVTLLGLFAPPPETADRSAILHGMEGVAACDVLLSGDKAEGNESRRIKLQLARAIHLIEAKQYDDAIASLDAMSVEYAHRKSDVGFALSDGLSIMEIKIYALAGLNEKKQASSLALDMSEAAPYDPISAQRANKLLRLAGEYGPREQKFYDRYVRLLPSAVLDRSYVGSFAGDFVSAADDTLLFRDLIQSWSRKDGKDDINYSYLYIDAAVSYALAGDWGRANEYYQMSQAEEARFRHKQATNQNTLEMNDFFRIIQLIKDENFAEARLLFAGRSKWNSPTPTEQAKVAEMLRAVSTEEQYVGLLKKDPADYLIEYSEEKLSFLNNLDDDDDSRYGAIHPDIKTENFQKFSRNVWREKRIKYFDKKISENIDAWRISTSRDGLGMEGGYALLLASALEAKKRGHTHFMLSPVRTNISYSFVRFGDAVEDVMFRNFGLEADQVIADLSLLIPRPAKK